MPSRRRKGGGRTDLIVSSELGKNQPMRCSNGDAYLMNGMVGVRCSFVYREHAHVVTTGDSEGHGTHTVEC